MARLGMRSLLKAAAGTAIAGTALGRLFAPSLRGKVVLIAGGSRGLGLLLAEEFARQGCRLVLGARDGQELERARERIAGLGAPVLAQATDVSHREEVDRLVAAAGERFGRVDVLVNVASIIQAGPLEAMRLEDFETAMAVDFFGTLHAVLAVLPSMRARRSGQIVNVTSIGGKVAVPHLLPYTCAKFAAVGLSEGLFAELRREGIAVTTVVPGLMRTGSAENALFKGQQALEKTWFALGSTLPLTAMDARRAARRIALATRRREAFVVLSWQARFLRLAHDLFPSATLRALAALDGLLPASPAPTSSLRGGEVHIPEPIERMIHRDAERTNELGHGDGAVGPAPM